MCCDYISFRHIVAFFWITIKLALMNLSDVPAYNLSWNILSLGIVTFVIFYKPQQLNRIDLDVNGIIRGLAIAEHNENRENAGG